MTISSVHQKRRVTQRQKEHTLIVGFTNKTGLSVAQYLSKYDIPFSISDLQSREHSITILKELSQKAIRIYGGSQDPSQLKGIQRIILSPGVPRSISLIKEAQNQGIEVTNEIELAYQLSNIHHLIGITGSHGKTTACTLLKNILEQAMPTSIGGNIGTAYISLIDNLKPNHQVILELSSFMLESMDQMQCDFACILNIHPNHLDRYAHINDYALAKKKIFRNQNPLNHTILNWNCPWRSVLSEGLQSKISYFSTDLAMPIPQKVFSYIYNNILYFKNEPIISLSCIDEKSLSTEILLAVITIAKQMNIPNTVVKQAIKNFKGLPHRLEYVAEKNGIRFINDSKSTSAQSTIYAIRSCNQPMHLLMGGYNKNIRFSDVQKHLADKVKSLILFGESAKAISQEIQFEFTYITNNLQEAFEQSIALAKKGDLILLSPGCASFDQYEHYEARGEHFKQLVKGYTLS